MMQRCIIYVYHLMIQMTNSEINVNRFTLCYAKWCGLHVRSVAIKFFTKTKRKIRKLVDFCVRMVRMVLLIGTVPFLTL